MQDSKYFHFTTNDLKKAINQGHMVQNANRFLTRSVKTSQLLCI